MDDEIVSFTSPITDNDIYSMIESPDPDEEKKEEVPVRRGLVRPPQGRGTSTIQSILFKKQYWTTPRARKWLKNNNFQSKGKVERKHKYLRFIQKTPNKNKQFRLTKLKPSVLAILEF